MSWRMNIAVIPSGRGCFNRLPCCRRFWGTRGHSRTDPPPTPMTEEEKERLDDLENLLPCHIYRRHEKEGDEESGPTYCLYDGFHQVDEGQPQQPLSLRLHQEECSICLMEYEDGDMLTSSHNPKCHHAFHRECIKRWLVSNSECPCCRKGFLEFDDSDDENDQASNSLGTRFAALTTSFQQQIRQVRQGLEDRLEPIILRLEQEREAMTDPDDTNRQGNHRGTHYQSDDDERSDDRPTLLHHRINRIREGVTDQLDNILVRVMEQRSMARLRGDATLATNTTSNHDRSGNDNHAPINATLATNISSNHDRSGNDNHGSINVQEQETPPNLLTVTTTRVLEMGSARWKDVSSRMVLLSQSFRGLEEPSSESNPQHGSPSRAEVISDSTA